MKMEKESPNQNNSSTLTTLKEKIRNILWSVPYCSICFKSTEDVWSIDAEFKVVGNGKPTTLCLQQIVQQVFHDVSILAGRHVCKQCTNQIISTFKFILHTKESAKELTKYLNDFHLKIIDLNNRMDQSSNYNTLKVIIVLEGTDVPVPGKDNRGGNNANQDKINIHNAEAKIAYKSTKTRPTIKNSPRKVIKKETNMSKNKLKINLSIKNMIQRRNGYECVKCKELFPKFNLWKRHEQTKHKKPIPKCKICCKTFDNYTILTEHYKVHGKLKCKICDLLVPDMEFNEHLKLNHEDETYPCQNCNMIYYTSVALVAHLKISHSSTNKDHDNENNQCLLCLQYMEKKQMDSHKCKGKCPDCPELVCKHYKYLLSFTEQKLNHCNKVKCVDCDYVCRKKEVLLVHVNREHLNHHPFTCGDCGTKYHSKDLLKRHIVNNHMELLICEFCDKTVLSASDLKAHRSTCQLNIREFECAYCQASFNTSIELASHEKLRHSTDNFPCNMCNRKFLTEENLISHKKRSHRSVQVTRRRQIWLCGLCDNIFGTKGECVQHRKTHDPNDKYMCRICDIEFESIKYLQWHNRVHREKKIQSPDKCPICGKVVKYLAPHLRLHRLANKKPGFVCEQCGKSFSTCSLLKSHGLVHLDRISCDICKKNVKPSTMVHHKKLHIKEKNTVKPIRKKIIKKQKQVKCIAKCEYCNYSPITAQRLEAHVNRYHLNIRPYVCIICNDSFCAREYLKMHMRVHSDEKKFTCEICNNKFRFKSCLRKHMLLHTGEKPYVCDICAEGFTGSSSLKEHRFKHFDKNVSCPLCSISFHSVRNMRHHFKKQHWKQTDKKFNPKELVGAEHHYLFEDRRKVTTEQ